MHGDSQHDMPLSSLLFWQYKEVIHTPVTAAISSLSQSVALHLFHWVSLA